MLNKIGNYYSATNMWYNDPEKYAAYEAALKDKSVNLPAGTIDVKYWEGKK
jgi:hypothetical protein